MKNSISPVRTSTIDSIRRLINESTSVQLPSIRNLARDLGVSPVTVLHALHHLQNEGLLKGGWGKQFQITRNILSGPLPAEKSTLTAVEKTVNAMKNDIVAGKYPTHLPLPSIKQLKTIYNVSYPSIIKTLTILRSEKIIRRSGSRHFFFTNTSSHRSIIAVVAFGTGRNAVKMETERERNFYRMLSTVANDLNVSIETVCYNDYIDNPHFYTSDDGPFPKYLKDNNVAGIILSSYHMKNSAECLRTLLTFSIPISVWVEDHRILKMTGRYGTRNLSFFDSSYSKIPGFEVGRYLIEKGHKNIAYISPFHESPWSQNRLSGLLKAAALTAGTTIHPFVNTEYLNDYFFLIKVQNENLFTKHYSVERIVQRLHPCLKDKISAVQQAHDMLLRDNLIFTECQKFINDATANESITAWVCANDHIAILVTDYWNYNSVPIEKRPALIGFDNSFQSFERNLSSYEFNTFGEIQHMVNHLLYPSSSLLQNKNQAVQVSGRIIERTSSLII